MATRGASLEVRDRQDAACGGIGKRRLIRPFGKTRQPGGEAEAQDGAVSSSAEEECESPSRPSKSKPPAYSAVLYTQPRQVSPGRHRGRRTRPNKVPKKDRQMSMWELMKMDDESLLEWCGEKGLLIDRRGELCPKCNEGELEVGPTRDFTSSVYVCPRRKCRYRESLTCREEGFFLPKAPLSKQVLALYKMVYEWQPGAATLAVDCDMSEPCMARLVDNVRAHVTYTMLQANNILQVGGEDEDVEADEVCFRSEPFLDDDGETQKRRWLRFLGVVRRGSALSYWGELEDRITEANQGGGGPISDDEVWKHFAGRASGRQLVAPFSVVHTDGAKAYLKLHRKKKKSYGAMRLWHTHVSHNRKFRANG